VMTTDLFLIYQQNADQQIAELKAAHARDVERLQGQLDKHKDQSATDKKAAADRASNQRAAIAICFLAAILPTVITLLRIGGT